MSPRALAELVKFGWATLQQKRLAVLLSIGPGLDLRILGKAPNTPYLVAAQLHDGREQVVVTHLTSLYIGRVFGALPGTFSVEKIRLKHHHHH